MFNMISRALPMTHNYVFELDITGFSIFGYIKIRNYIYYPQ